ncbi:hypothetical protein ACFL26_00975 [Patescibacteria group bacterium]
MSALYIAMACVLLVSAYVTIPLIAIAYITHDRHFGGPFKRFLKRYVDWIGLVGICLMFLSGILTSAFATEGSFSPWEYLWPLVPAIAMPFLLTDRLYRVGTELEAVVVRRNGGVHVPNPGWHLLLPFRGHLRTVEPKELPTRFVTTLSTDTGQRLLVTSYVDIQLLTEAAPGESILRGIEFLNKSYGIQEQVQEICQGYVNDRGAAVDDSEFTSNLQTHLALELGRVVDGQGCYLQTARIDKMLLQTDRTVFAR